MKNIHEAVQKELELQRMLNGAIREKELGLRQLKGILFHALNLVNGLLNETPAETISPVAQSESTLAEGVLGHREETENRSQEPVLEAEKEDPGSEHPTRDLP
jgi:hypothetical protein